MTTFKHPALKQLTDQQVRFVPPARRMEQLARAERLLAEIALDKQYPYQFVCFRITDYRPDAYPDLLIEGEDLTHDLGLFIAELAGSLPAIPAEELTEPVMTIDPLKGLHVATTRTTEDGLPEGGWIPSERLPLRKAIDAYTRDAAWASFDDQRKGMLARDMLADLVVLTDDIFSGPRSRLTATEVAVSV